MCQRFQLSPDGQLAITGDADGNVGSIATDAGAASWEAKLPYRISALQLSPDGTKAIVRAMATDTGTAS